MTRKNVFRIIKGYITYNLVTVTLTTFSHRGNSYVIKFIILLREPRVTRVKAALE